MKKLLAILSCLMILVAIGYCTASMGFDETPPADIDDADMAPQQTRDAVPTTSGDVVNTRTTMPDVTTTTM